jgi:hypothetical protein
MTRMNCPTCGLTVSLGRQETPRGETCPRCLARSSGAVSVRLRSGLAPKPKGTEARIREFLRRRSSSGATTG